MGRLRRRLLRQGGGLAIAATICSGAMGVNALPPPEDTPEEVLRTRIILEARSPIDGTPLTAADYAQLQADLRRRDSAQLSSEVREIIFLLQLRRALRPFLPFLP